MVAASHWRWPPTSASRIVGAGQAFDLILTARTVEADEALRIGLVSRLSTASLLDEALAIAETLCGYGKFGLESTKQVLWANLEAPCLQAALQVENRSQILSSTSGESADATAAFKTRKGERARRRPRPSNVTPVRNRGLCFAMRSRSTLPRRPTAIDDDDLTGDVTACRRTQQQCSTDHFVGRGQPVHQCAADHGVDRLLRVVAHHVGIDRAGRDRVHSDT
jgi:hypothetical protein